MATVLTIATADIRRLAGIDSSDTSQDSAIADLVTAEQLVHEYALDQGILANAVAGDAGLLATLTLGVAEVMAGDYLQESARQGSITEFKVGGLQFTLPAAQSPFAVGASLTNQGLARLLPFTRAARNRAASAAGVLPDADAAIPALVANGIADPSVFDRLRLENGGRGECEGEGVVFWGGPE